ncbi:MAG: Hpt domain-containing protein [Treponema sp.]|nr:Hpt domain-containing protein [Treponema sp.]
MITIEGLRAFGADVDEGLARCLNKEDFYLKMVNMGLADDRFDRLPEILASKDLDAAFECVHAMKGVVANLALTPLLAPIEKMTELLRGRTDTDYAPLANEIKAQRDRLLSL